MTSVIRYMANRGMNLCGNKCFHQSLKELPRAKLNTKTITHHYTLNCKQFHTSSKTQAIPFLAPLLLKLSTPLSRILFLLLGRRFRKWWQTLPPEVKEKYLGRLTTNRDRFAVFVASLTGITAGYYFYHLEETPVTGRKRFIILNKEQLESVANVQWRNLDADLASSRLPVDNVAHMKVFNIAKRIIKANASKEVNAVSWEINVIESNDVNAFVLANGQMYVFTGMLSAVANDNELAGILGHEMAHAILNHSAEQLSRTGFVNLYSIALITLLWAIIPSDGLALVANWLQSIVEDVLITLPYSRKLEKEADEVGLLMAARACYDVRHIPEFWQRMHHFEGDELTQLNSWLSTHPSHENRVTWLREWLPTALELRKDFKCPELIKFFDSKKTILDK